MQNRKNRQVLPSLRPMNVTTDRPILKGGAAALTSGGALYERTETIDDTAWLLERCCECCCTGAIQRTATTLDLDKRRTGHAKHGQHGEQRCQYIVEASQQATAWNCKSISTSEL